MTSARHRRHGCRPLILGVVAAVVIAACSPGDESSSPTSSTATTPGPDANGSNTPTDGSELADIGLVATDVAPFDRVELTGLARIGDPSGLELWLRTGDGDIGLPLYANDNGAHFAAPLHPATPYDGGSTELYVARDGEIGPILDLDIGSLSASPGAWDEFLDAFREAIDRAAAAAGSSFSELAATDFADVAPELIPLKLAQGYLDDGSEHDLESFADRSDFTEADQVALDDLTGQLELIRLVRPPDEPDGFRRPDPQATITPASMATVGRSTPARPTVGRSAPQQSGGSCTDPGIEIADAADLASKLTTARDNAIMEGGAREEVLDGISSATTAGGFVPGIGPGAAGIGASFLALEAYLNGTAGLYPSSLGDLDATLVSGAFPEDFRADGSWQGVTVTARSTGWQADADIIATLLAAASAATSGAANLSVAQGFLLDVQLYLRDNVANQAVGASGGVLNFCPQEWTVDVTGEPWTRGRAVLERFEVDSSSQSFRPIETGLNLPVDDTLRVEVDRDLFAGQQASRDFTIEVLPIIVSAADEVEVDQPGDDVDIDVKVANALNAELDWDSGEGGWKGSADLVSAGDIIGPPAQWRRTHASSGSEDDFPYLVVMDSTASTGLRADGEPPRRDIVRVVLAQLVVTPENDRVFTGNTLQFSARDRNGNDVDVEWTATGGSIDSNGLYTAGRTPGLYTVTATSRDDSDLTDTVGVEVVEEDCVVGRWRLREQAFLDQVARLAPQSGSISHKGGQYLLNFGENGAYTGSRQQWRIGVGTPAGELDVLIDSAESGTWSVDTGAERLTVTETSSDVSVTLSLNGVVVPGGDQFFTSSTVSGEGSYTCEGDVLEVTIVTPEATVVATMDRIG